MAVGTALGVIAIERLLNASLLPSTANGASTLSIRLGTSFICGGLAPLIFGIGYLKAHRAKTEATQSED
jgi:hypothetical protein